MNRDVLLRSFLVNVRSPIVFILRAIQCVVWRRSTIYAMGIAGMLQGTMGWAQLPPDKSGVKPSVISLPSGAGSIEGLGESFEAQLNTGGSTYGLSIALPPGRAGLAPSVRLDYNSNTANGICGLGWSMKLVSIQRQTDKGFPEYDDTDAFLFQGEELVPLSNTEGDWRCENERGFQRLRQLDSDDDGAPDAWEIWERNGIRHTLGRFRDALGRISVVEHPEKRALAPFDRTYCWMVDTTTDLHGNRIEYEYTLGTGVLYISRISFSHMGRASQEVLFRYESRADAFDDYRPTFSARLDRRLRRIEVRSEGKLVRSYRFDYAYEDGDLTPELATREAGYLDLGVTLLRRVVQVDRSGSDANYLPPLVFAYSGLDLNLAELRDFVAPPELDLADQSGRVQLADVDGDALPDLYSTSAEGAGKGQRVCLNRGEVQSGGKTKLEFATSRLVLSSSPVDLAEANTVIHDPRSKGLVDVSCLIDDGGNKRLETFGNRARLDFVNEERLGFSDEDLEMTLLENPPSFVTYSEAHTRQMDVNFDKKGDFVNLEPSFGAMKVNTFYIDRRGKWVAGESMLPSSYPLANTFQDEEGLPNACVHLADMNGDRMLDLVCLDPEPDGAGQRISVSYWPLCGLSRYADERAMLPASLDTFGIGTVDLRDVFLADFTGDGLADVAVLDGSGPEPVLTLRVNIAGQRWSTPFVRRDLPRYVTRGTSQPTILRLADVNGNGSLDLLFRNTAPQDDWTYLEMLPLGKPSLMTSIDNGLGKRTTVVYGTAAEDERLARDAGHPWQTFAPIALQVVRQIRVRCGLDLNGDGREDTAVSEFRYRDPYYDGFEREFRGFAFAQRIDYGDDFLFDPVTGLMETSSGWDRGLTPTGQVSGPSLVTRFRFHTGASDRRDNDDYVGELPLLRLNDEITEVSGREEEALKGLKFVEEKIDPVVLHGVLNAGFDEGCEAAALATSKEGEGRMTPDAYVYTRSRQEWTVRRLYRPAEALGYLADQDADGVLEDYRAAPVAPIPAGRFAAQGVHVVEGNGRSVSFAFVRETATEVREANGLLSSALGYPSRDVRRTTQGFKYDDFGNQTELRDLGIDGGDYNDERVVSTTFAHGGNALSLWIIDRPDTIRVTDENGSFVATKVHFYDGAPFVGIQGQINDRALLHRTVEHIDEVRSIEATRSRFDAFGNIVESRDPVGNVRRNEWDPVFRTYPVTEIIVVGGGSPDLRVEAEYDLGFGVVTKSTDFNGNVTTYTYDSFARQVSTVRPGDSAEKPTAAYEYQLTDPIRGRSFVYDAAGNLSVVGVPLGSASRVISRNREIEGEEGEYVTVNYTDGCGKTLATVEEGEEAGTWVVSEASSYNLRTTLQATWLPFQISSAVVPQFPLVWPAGRPPANDGVHPMVVSTDVFSDPLGRQIRTVLPPETWNGGRRETASYLLPFETHEFDEEDLHVGSAHEGTPHVSYTDGLGRVVAVEEVVKLTDTGLAGPRTTWRTEYAYDLNDKLIRIEDSQGNVKTMFYDGLMRMTEMNDPDCGPAKVSYDDASNVLETLDAKGQRIVYTYDGVNRIKTEDYQDGGARVFDVEYFYDIPATELDLGDGTTGTAGNTKGQLAYVRDLSGEAHFSYDARARQEWEVKRIPDSVTGQLLSYRTGFAYDSLDRLTTLTYPDRDELVHTYNPRSLAERIQGALLGDVIRSIEYVPSGQWREIQHGNGVGTSHDYDPRLRMTSLQTLGPANDSLIDFQYTFDGASNVKAIEDRRNLAGQPEASERFNTQVFTYDDVYRLTQVKYPVLGQRGDRHVDYRYDRIGNMLSQRSDIVQEERGVSVTDLGTLAYGGDVGPSNRMGREASDPPGPHALTAITPPSEVGEPKRRYRYDANGNMTEIDGLVCEWDFKDRLVAVEDGEMRAEYTYDFSDRRITKKVHWKDPSPEKGAQPSELDPDWRVTSTQYINQYFEVREHDAWVKYVWNGATRVARVTARLGGQHRIQHLRLQDGWNLVSLQVGGQFPVLDPAKNADLVACVYGAEAGSAGDWAEVTESTELPAGATLWVLTERATSVMLAGVPAPDLLASLTGESQFIGNVLQEPFDLTTVFPAEALVGRFDSRANQWRYWSGREESLLRSSDEQSLVLPGRAVWTRGGAPGPIGEGLVSLRVRYYHQDHLGSSSVIADAEGALVEENAFYPFGHPRNEHRLREVVEAYTFTQKERDKESGLHYFEARYLVATLSRFVSVDPKYAYPGGLSEEDLGLFLSEPQEINLYAYVRNNPLRYVDPTGLGPCSWLSNPYVGIPGCGDTDWGKTARVTVKAAASTLATASCVGGNVAGCVAAVKGWTSTAADVADIRDPSEVLIDSIPGVSTKRAKQANIVIDVTLGALSGGVDAASSGQGVLQGGAVGAGTSAGVEIVSHVTQSKPRPRSRRDIGGSTTGRSDSDSGGQMSVADPTIDHEEGVCRDLSDEE